MYPFDRCDRQSAVRLSVVFARVGGHDGWCPPTAHARCVSRSARRRTRRRADYHCSSPWPSAPRPGRRAGPAPRPRRRAGAGWDAALEERKGGPGRSRSAFGRLEEPTIFEGMYTSSECGRTGGCGVWHSMRTSAGFGILWNCQNLRQFMGFLDGSGKVWRIGCHARTRGILCARTVEKLPCPALSPAILFWASARRGSACRSVRWDER